MVHEAPSHLRDIAQEDADIVALYLLTGSRRSEILGLRRDQICDSYLVFPPRKRGRERRFTLTSELSAILSRHAGSGEWIFPKSKGEGHRHDLRRFWSTLTKRAGCPGLRIHDLRHTAITERVRKGGVLEGQALAGHRTPEMVHRIYTHLHAEPLKPLEVRVTQMQHPPRKARTERRIWNREIIENTEGP
jgi:integrase